MLLPSPVEILRTKLYRPQPPERLLKRRRLLQQLDEGLHCPISLVTAPAGYGKTILLSSWLAIQGHLACWVSLDAADNELPVFLAYLVAALQTHFPGACSDTAALLSAPDPPPLSVLQTRLMNELDLLPHPLVIVLDDYHLIHCREIHDFIIHLVNSQPPGIHLVIGMRGDPPFPLAVWRARQQIKEISTQDLCFTLSETEQLLKNILGNSLSGEMIKILNKEAEGWVTGLQLAAFSLRNSIDQTAFVNSFKKFSSQNIREFLLDQAFVNQPRLIQEFLLKTAILDRFSASLCNALGLSGESLHSTQDTIDILRRANLFIVPLDDQGEWFRYHYLFAEMLQNRLKKLFEPQAISTLHSSAAEWFTENGYIEDAIEHALAAGKEFRAVQIVEEHIFEALNREKMATIDRWLASLPPVWVERRPRLMMVKAWVANYRNPFEAAPGFLIKAESMLDFPQEDLDPQTRILLAGYNAALWPVYLISTGEFERGASLGEFALQTLPLDHLYVRGRAMVGWALCMQALGKGSIAEAFLLQERERHPEINTYSLSTLYALATLYVMNSKLDELEQTGLKLCKDTESTGFQILAGWGHYFSGMVYFMRNDLLRAQKYLEVAAGMQYIVSKSIVRESMVALILAAQAMDQQNEAQEAFKRLLQFEDHFMMDHHLSLKARMALNRGDLKSAQQWSLNSLLPPRNQLYVWQEIPAFTQARIWIGEETPASLQNALALLVVLLEIARRTYCGWREIEFLIWMAIAYFKVGQKGQALESLSLALRLAEPGKLIYPFMEARVFLPGILALVDGKSDEAEFARQILTNITSSIRIVEPYTVLTSREVEILKLRLM